MSSDDVAGEHLSEKCGQHLMNDQGVCSLFGRSGLADHNRVPIDGLSIALATMHMIGSMQVQCQSRRSPHIATRLANSNPSTSGCDCACTLVIHDNDASW
jgi:hypothetical protein